MAQAYGMWLPLKLYSFCFWAFDQFCLNSRPVPLEIAGQMQVSGAQYFKPRAARAVESVIAEPVGDRGAAARSIASSEREETQWLTSRPPSTAPSTLYSPVDAFSTKPLETTATERDRRGRLDHQRRVHHRRLRRHVRHPLHRRRADRLHRARPARSSPAASAERSGPPPPATRNGVAVKANMVAGFITALQSAVLAIENELGTAAARNYVRKDGAVTITGLKTFQDGAEFGVGQQSRHRPGAPAQPRRGQVAQGRQLRRPRDGAEREQPPRDGRHHRLRGGPDVRRVLVSGRHDAPARASSRSTRSAAWRWRRAWSRWRRPASWPARTRRSPWTRRGASRLARRWSAGDLPAHTHVASDIVSGALPFTIQKAGTAVGTRRALNLIEGANITLTVADDAGNDRVNVTVAAAAARPRTTCCPRRIRTRWPPRRSWAT